MDEVLVIDDGIEEINNYAFVSCENTKIVLIPKTVEKVEDFAFDGSRIEVVIFMGEYTQWRVNASVEKPMYVFCKKDSNVRHSLSLYDPQPYVYMKKVDILDNYMSPHEEKKIAEACYGLMDEKSDEDMMLRPYDWKREACEKR
jgi:hypothetical protein